MGSGLGGRAEITDRTPKHDWKIPGYWGEGFYHVRTIPEQREMLVSQDDLVLDVKVFEDYEFYDTPWGRRHKYLQAAFIDQVVDKDKSLDDPSAKFMACIAGSPRTNIIGETDSLDRAKVMILRYFTKHPEEIIEWRSEKQEDT